MPPCLKLLRDTTVPPQQQLEVYKAAVVRGLDYVRNRTGNPLLLEIQQTDSNSTVFCHSVSHLSRPAVAS